MNSLFCNTRDNESRIENEIRKFSDGNRTIVLSDENYVNCLNVVKQKFSADNALITNYIAIEVIWTMV